MSSLFAASIFIFVSYDHLFVGWFSLLLVDLFSFFSVQIKVWMIALVLEDGFIYSWPWILVFDRILDDLISRSIILELDLSWVCPGLIGHPNKNCSVVNFGASSSQLSVLMVIQTNYRICSGCRHYSFLFVCPTSTLWSNTFSYYYELGG